jgi:GNAT superfamily N-acetyltransferase
MQARSVHQVPEMMFSIRNAAEADRDVLALMVREMMPGVDAESRLRWLYDANPAGHALTWLACADDGNVAGCTSFFPFRLQVDGAQALGALGGDGWVRPAYRRRGIGAALHEASRSALGGDGLACMYGAPGAMNVTPLKHGGSREVCTVSRWVRPLRGIAAGLAWFEAIPRTLRPRDAARLEPMVPHDPRVDDVWAIARDDLALGAVRDATFYTWRFLDSPSHREPAYVVVRGDRPIGACALEVMNGGKNLRIVDLIAAPGEWHAAMRAIVGHAAMTPALTVDIKLATPDARRREMWRSGFIERESKPFLVMLPADGDRRLVDPARWFYSGADSDLDFLD